jgi:hypothetical protein
LNSCQTVEYAAAELSKYLGIMANDEEIGSIVNDKNEKDGISLGLFKDFGISDDFLKDPELDDQTRIDKETYIPYGQYFLLGNIKWDMLSSKDVIRLYF